MACCGITQAGKRKLKNFWVSLWVVLFFVASNVAKADFPGAIDALQTNDIEKMLFEVRNAAETRHEEDLILFLSLLKEYPYKWQPLLTSNQQSELFQHLEIATSEASLLSQYKLALIPRNNSLNAAVESELRRRLEPLASKYAPAALHLYGSYALHPKNEKAYPDKALFWLKKSAELGSSFAAFILGMKYLHIADSAYGCDNSTPLLCPAKDEKMGWYWMRQAAKNPEELDLILGDFSAYMGEILEGNHGVPTDLKQAYLWYLLALNSPWHYSSPSGIEKRLAELKMKGQLSEIAPELDENWADVKKRRELLHPQKLPEIPRLYDRNTEPNTPLISLRSDQWLKNVQVLDIYTDGSVYISSFEQFLPVENEETVLKISSAQAQEIIRKLKQLGFYDWHISNENEGCFTECFQLRKYFLSVRDDTQYRNVLLSSKRPLENPQIAAVLKLLHEYFPKYFPVDALRYDLSDS